MLLAGLAAVSILAAVLIFGDTPALRHSPVNRLRLGILRLTSPISRQYASLNALHFDGNLTYLLGYLIPAAHLLFVSLCLYFFKAYTFPSLNATPQVSTAIVFSSLAIYLTTFIAVFSDPGAVADHPDWRQRFTNNQLIFFDGNICSTCKLLKPGRSKHCSHCGRCFLLFDHHCLWINNCVAYSNFKWFLLYLVCHIQFLIFGVVLCDRSLRRQASSRWDYYHTIKHTNFANRVTGGFLCICAIFSIVVTLFAGCHLYYLYLGVTTNEVPKWEGIEYLTKIKKLYRIENRKIRGESYVEKEDSQIDSVYLSLRDEAILFCERDRPKYTLTRVESIENEILNVYDRGLYNNIKERVFNSTFSSR